MLVISTRSFKAAHRAALWAEAAFSLLLLLRLPGLWSSFNSSSSSTHFNELPTYKWVNCSQKYMEGKEWVNLSNLGFYGSLQVVVFLVLYELQQQTIGYSTGMVLQLLAMPLHSCSLGLEHLKKHSLRLAAPFEWEVPSQREQCKTTSF